MFFNIIADAVSMDDIMGRRRQHAIADRIQLTRRASEIPFGSEKYPWAHKLGYFDAVF